MKVFLVSATTAEVRPTLEHLERSASRTAEGSFLLKRHTVVPLVTGVGLASCAFALGNCRAIGPECFILHAGISGSFSDDLPTGSLVEVTEERWGDLGAENADGSISDVFELGLAEPDLPPYRNGVLINPHGGATGLRSCRGLTVSKSSGTRETIRQILGHGSSEVESMEGAAVFYSSLSLGVPFVSVRAVSNKVETRDRSRWNIPLAIKNLNQFIHEYLAHLQ